MLTSHAPLSNISTLHKYRSLKKAQAISAEPNNPLFAEFPLRTQISFQKLQNQQI